jgi:hypothetical protein
MVAKNSIMTRVGKEYLKSQMIPECNIRMYSDVYKNVWKEIFNMH